MRLIRPALACAALMSATTLSHAAPAAAPAAASAPATAPNPNQPIVSVNGQVITLADVQHAAAGLGPQIAQLPQQQVLQMLVSQLIQQRAVQIAAYKEGLDKKPDVHAAMQAAANGALQNAYLAEKVSPQINDAAMQAYYQSHYANQKAEEQVHARHILVKTEAEAKDIINQLNHGGDFAKLAAEHSTDTGSAKNDGGDLGWFKRSDMVPAFSDAAFKMKPNTISQTPVKSEFGWHVIQVLGTREAPAPKFDEVKNNIRQQLIQQDVHATVDSVMKQVTVVQYDQQGKPVPAAAQTPAAKH